MTKEQLIERIRTEAADDRLACDRAYDLAQELKVPLGEIGKICNELRIKIVQCQLGCF